MGAEENMDKEAQPSEKQKVHSINVRAAIVSFVVVIAVAGVGGGLWWALSAPSSEEVPLPSSEPAADSPINKTDDYQAEPAVDNGMTVLYENEYYIVSLPAEKVGYAKWSHGGGLDKNTKWDTFSYDPPGENNGAGVTITTAFVDASSSTESYFDQFLGRGSSGVYVYAMEAGGTFFGDAGAGGVVTLK